MTIAALLQVTIVIYLAIGVYMVTFGRISVEIRKEWHSLRGDVSDPSRPGKNAGVATSRTSTWKLITYVTVIGLIGVLGWLIFLPGLRTPSPPSQVQPPESDPLGAEADASRHRGPPTDVAREPTESGVRLETLRGAGDVICRACGHVEDVTGSLHGFGDEPWIQKGHQCVGCRAIVTVTTPYHGAAAPERCDCGGELTREGLLKCPVCGSEDIDYQLSIMT